MTDKDKKDHKTAKRNLRLETPEDTTKARRDLDRELDRLETKIEELKILYEQFFVDVLPQPPDQLRLEVLKTIKKLLKAPFKNSASRFRLRMLVQRYQTYGTYWERVNKQREEGTYFRDVFKADMREKADQQAAEQATKKGAAENAFRQLYSSYEEALRKTGKDISSLNYDAFKKSLVKKAKELKEKAGAKKLSYKIVVKDGKVVVKASAK